MLVPELALIRYTIVLPHSSSKLAIKRRRTSPKRRPDSTLSNLVRLPRPTRAVRSAPKREEVQVPRPRDSRPPAEPAAVGRSGVGERGPAGGQLVAGDAFGATKTGARVAEEEVDVVPVEDCQQEWKKEREETYS